MKLNFTTFPLLTAFALGGELTIKSESLEATLELDAHFIPAEAVVIEIEPKRWSSYKITELVEHGTVVKQGDTLIAFEDEDYQKDLFESQEDAKVRKIALANAERELADLEVTTPRTLEGLKLAYERAKEGLDYFTETGRELNERDAKENVARAERSLNYQEEELKQLLKMYEEDGITEETEEIILTRQKASVETARFFLEKAKENSKWTLEKTIPRQAVDLKRSFSETALAYETGQLTLPRALEEKTLAVAKAKRRDEKADEELAELIADGEFFQIEAPSDGVVYYGEIDDRSWSPATSSKFLFENGVATAATPLLTLIPAGSALTLQGQIDQKDRLNLPADAEGTATVEGLNDVSFPIKVTSIALAPDAAGKYHVAMSVELPEESPILTGMKAKAKLLTYKKEEAISVPKKAVTTKDGVSTVILKMADGKNETREVRTGRSANGKIEILEGLEVDQVILIPEEEKE